MELLYDVKDGVATLTLNRPEKLNAVTDAMRQGLARHVEEINHDPEVRVVVVRGSGTRAFSAGSDIYETSGRTPVEKRDTVEMEAPHLLRRCIKPVVAMIRGYALGGGLELALACDLRIASETAQFGLPEVTLGWIPGAGGTQYLPRLVGRGMAAYLLYTGERIDATQAKAIGLVDVLVPDDALEAETARVAALDRAEPARSARVPQGRPPDGGPDEPRGRGGLRARADRPLLLVPGSRGADPRVP